MVVNESLKAKGTFSVASFDRSGALMWSSPEKDNLIVNSAYKGFTNLLMGGKLDIRLGTGAQAASVSDLWVKTQLEAHYSAAVYQTQYYWTEYIKACRNSHTGLIYEIGTTAGSYLISRVVIPDGFPIVDGGKTVVRWQYGINV